MPILAAFEPAGRAVPEPGNIRGTAITMATEVMAAGPVSRRCHHDGYVREPARPAGTCPKSLALETEIELDIVLVSRPLGYGNVVVSSRAHVKRVEPANMPGWFGIAVSFDDFAFDRDDNIPGRFSAAD